MKFHYMNQSNGENCKSYKTVKNARKELARLEKELCNIDAHVKFNIAINDCDRFYLQFLIDAQASVSFHYYIDQGHCVVVQ